MRVEVHPADDTACGRYRLRWPAAMLASQGHDVVLGSSLNAVWEDRADGSTPEALANLLLRRGGGVERRLIGMEAPDADVVVIQRPLRREMADAIPHLQAKGVAVVVEIDDDFSALPPANTVFNSVHPRRNPTSNWEHLRRACAEADLVTCTTPALAARYGHKGRVAVLPNLVPAHYLDVVAERDATTVGWSGSVDTHPGDLEVTRGAVGRAVAATEAQFRVVGTGKGVQGRLGLADPPLTCGWVPIEEYPLRVAELDVGIVPLGDSAFNAAKSALKMAEMLALGVVPVVSPSPDNLRLHRHGAGLVARRPRDWERAITTLIRNPGLRSDLAASGRELMRAQTIEGNAERWWEAWTEAAAVRALDRVGVAS